MSISPVVLSHSIRPMTRPPRCACTSLTWGRCRLESVTSRVVFSRGTRVMLVSHLLEAGDVSPRLFLAFQIGRGVLVKRLLVDPSTDILGAEGVVTDVLTPHTGERTTLLSSCHVLSQG